MKFKNITKEKLNETVLAVVRELGRQIGVRSPSNKKKEELIEDILAIYNGDQAPDFSSSKKGAPPKGKVDISDFIDYEYFYDEEKYKKPYPDYDDSVSKIRFDDSGKDEIPVEGVYEQTTANYGFLRVDACDNSQQDAYVSWNTMKYYNLRPGDEVKGFAVPVEEQKLPSLKRIEKINGCEPRLFLRRANFDSLTPDYPTKKLNLDFENDLSLRCIDLFSPIGLGQRGLIVAPPKTGKTTLLKKIAQAIETNHPEIKLFVVLIDERPEEVTDFMRCINSPVISSTFDEGPERHVRVVERVLNRAKRLVEVEQHVVILMDSITRLARAYNNVIEPSGRTLSGGLDPSALIIPKRIFGSARNIEKVGSLTILSTALVETGSRMDDIIFEEFKGTGNMEIHLSRELSEKRIFPAIDLYKSGTRKDELLLSTKQYDIAMKIRKILSEKSDATDSLLDMMKKTKDNEEFIKKAEVWLKLYSK